MSEFYRGVWVVAYREVLRFVVDRPRIVASLVFPILFLAVFGGGFANVVGRMTGGVDLIQFMYPGIVAQTVLITSLVAGISVVADRESGFLREILVAPLSRTGIVLGKAAGAAAVALLQAVLLLVVAPVVGVRVDITVVAMLVPVVGILSFGPSGLGILIASFLRSQQGFQMIYQVLVFPLIFLAGVFFPVDTVPLWMEIASKVNPVTYGVDALRQVFLGSLPVGLGVTVFGHPMALLEELVLVGSLGVLLLTAAAVAFDRQE